MYDFQTEKTERVAPGVQPNLLPDGSKVVFWTSGGVIIRSLDGSEPDRQLGLSSPIPLLVPPDGSEIVYATWDVDRREHTWEIHSINVETPGKTTRVLHHPKYQLWPESFTPDGRWITFVAAPRASSRLTQVFVAPYRGGGLIEEKDWIEITDGSSGDAWPRFSPDGNRMYFVSDRDGFHCIWTQRLDPQTKKPVPGGLREVRHFHSARLSMNIRRDLGGLSVARDKIVFSLAERTGNIWMAELTEE